MSQCDEALTQVKSVVCNYPVLRAPDFDKPLIVAVDAIGVGAGAILLQLSENEVEHPVSYFSKTFNRAQRN